MFYKCPCCGEVVVEMKFGELYSLVCSDCGECLPPILRKEPREHCSQEEYDLLHKPSYFLKHYSYMKETLKISDD